MSTTLYRWQLSWIINVDQRLYFAATLFYKLNQSGQPAYLAKGTPHYNSERHLSWNFEKFWKVFRHAK